MTHFNAMTQGKCFKISLCSIFDLADQEQRLIHEQALRRIAESGAQLVENDRDDVDALLVLVLHGNSARADMLHLGDGPPRRAPTRGLTVPDITTWQAS